MEILQYDNPYWRLSFNFIGGFSSLGQCNLLWKTGQHKNLFFQLQ